MVDYTVNCAVDCNVYVVHCTVDYMVDYTIECSVSVVHSMIDCSIDRCMVSCTDYDFSSMISTLILRLKNCTK